MCYSIASSPNERDLIRIEHDFAVNWKEEDSIDMHYVASGFSHPKLPVIMADREFKKLRWGLIPSWVKDWESARKLRIQTLNAMAETVDSKPSYRGAVKSGRMCIIPVNGFFEWHHHANGEKYPHFIHPAGDSIFYLAGLFERWVNEAIGEEHHTFTIVTTSANKRMEWIHNSKKRMPVILTAAGAKTWLDTSLAFSQKKELLVPFDDSLMQDHPVSRLITSRTENPNVPAVRAPYTYPELSATLFD